MKVQCSKCESTYNIKDEKIPDAGAKIKCPKCQNVISVMKPAPEPPEISLSQPVETDIQKDNKPKDEVSKKSKAKMPSKLIVVFGTIVVILALIWHFSGAPLMRTGASTSKSEEPIDYYVLMVKTGTFNNYPGKNIGDAIDDFMANPKCESGTGSDGTVFVNVTGTINYMDRETTALLQFKIDSDRESFMTHALEFNGIPQNKMMINALIEKMYRPNSQATENYEYAREDTQKTKEQNKGPIAIQGFYIGMPLTEAVKLINGKHSSAFVPFTVWLLDNEYMEWIQWSKPSKVEVHDGGGTYRSDYTLTFDQCFVMKNEIIAGKQNDFKADEQGNLALMVLSPLTVNKLFNVEDMDAEDFVQAFVDAYKIPQMDHEYGSNSFYWEYTSPTGFKITIYEDKSLKMEKVAKASERSFG